MFNLKSRATSEPEFEFLSLFESLRRQLKSTDREIGNADEQRDAHFCFQPLFSEPGGCRIIGGKVAD